jgi:serine/threonine-protein kinase
MNQRFVSFAYRAIGVVSLTTGHLAFVTKGTLYAVPFDLDRLEVRGSPTPILEDASADISFGTMQLDVSQSGTMVYLPGRTTGLRVVQWLNREGKTESLLEDPAYYQMPRVSPDGSRLAYVLTEGSNSHIWVYDLAATQLTWVDRSGQPRGAVGAPGEYENPALSPDGQRLAVHRFDATNDIST